MFNFPKHPSTPVDQDSSIDDASNSNSMSPTPSMNQSSPESCDSASKGSSGWQNNNRRRRRGAPRNTEKRPYHSPTHVSPPHDKPMTKNDLYFALDCEMVGIGPEGLDSAVARVTICNWAEEVVLDTYVKVSEEVTDYRTFVSGIEAKDLEDDRAMSLPDVHKMVRSILHGKILIGHALENDMTALQMTHPWHDTRDTASYPPYMKKAETDKTALRPRKLKELVRDKLGRDIQNLGVSHDPIEDARSALGLYKLVRMEWEKWVMQQVASARVKEGRESEPSGRESPYSNSGGFRPPNATTAGYPHLSNIPNMPTMAATNHSGNMNQAAPLYYRTRSAPDPRRYGRQVSYPRQQYYSY